jgi:glycerol-3-phosphate dehydrogenase (NAD(P)+)
LKITVLGAGSWGTTLALVLHQNGHHVTCWSIEKEDIELINKTRENRRFLPGILIPDDIFFTNSLSESLKSVDVVVVAVPSQAVRSVLEQIKTITKIRPIWVNVAKGIENKTLLRVSQVIQQVMEIEQEKIAVLSGPSHAEEVSRYIPTTIVAASKSSETANLIQKLFTRPYLRVYTNMDISGVELGGALKNIIAVAAGICDGAGFGDNTKAALITRCLVEINRLGIKLGAKPDTFAGLSGMGDLIVTCMSKHSRNRYVGEQIGKGRTLQDILNEMIMVAEGVKTTESAYNIAQNEGVEMPITEKVYQTLFQNKPPADAVKELMTRASKTEDWG